MKTQKETKRFFIGNGEINEAYTKKKQMKKWENSRLKCGEMKRAIRIASLGWITPKKILISVQCMNKRDVKNVQQTRKKHPKKNTKIIWNRSALDQLQ